MRQYADFNKIQRFACGLEYLKQRADNIATALINISGELDWEIGNIDDEISSALTGIQKDIGLISMQLKKHENYLWDVRYSYLKLEKQLSNSIDNMDGNNGAAQTDAGSREASMISNIYKNIISKSVISKIKLPDLDSLNELYVTSGTTIDRDSSVVEPWLIKAAEGSIRNDKIEN